MTQASPPREAASWLHRVSRLTRPLSVSVLNQCVGSGANFALGLYLVRTLIPMEFGLYGIALVACLLYAGLGDGLFLKQMVVHLPDRRRIERACYAASILALVGLFSLSTLMLASLLIGAALMAGWPSVDLGHLALATVASAIANLMKNYFVTLAYSLKQESKALTVNTAWAFALLLILATLHDSGWVTDAASALWIFAAANLVAALFGFGITSLPLKEVRWQAMRHDFAEAFVGGRWAAGGTTVIWLQSQAYVYVTTIFVGPMGVALANASRMLVTPFTFLLPAITQLLLPRLAGLRNSDKGAMYRMGELYTVFLAGLGALYLLILWFGATKLIPLLVGERYSVEEILPLLMAWGCVLLLQLTRDGASLTMLALKAFRRLLFVNAATATVAIFTSVILAIWFGIPGAIFGVGVGEALLAASLWYLIRRERNNHDH